MTAALQRLVQARAGLLRPGEIVLAAGRAHTVSGTESAEVLPPSTIWAVSSQRLFVFDSDGRTRQGLAEPVLVVDLGEAVGSARTEPFDDHDVLLIIEADAQPATVVMEPEDAVAIADVIRDAAERARASVADDRQGSDLSTTGGLGDFAVRGVDDRADVSDGDPDVDSLRTALAEGDWEQSASVLSAADTARREWLIRHLTGEELVDALEAWVAAEPDSADAYLVRGANTVWRAWARRKAMDNDLFWDELRQAEMDLFWALELNFADAVAFTPLIRSARGLGVATEELCVRFDESVHRAPGLLGVHLETLVALSPLAHRSVTEMMGLVESVISTASEGSPLHALVACAHLIGLDQQRSMLRRSDMLSSEAIRDIELAATMSVDSSRWEAGAGEAEVLNIFAAAFAKSGDHARALALLSRVDGQQTRVPWSLFSDGGSTFQTLSVACE